MRMDGRRCLTRDLRRHLPRVCESDVRPAFSLAFGPRHIAGNVGGADHMVGEPLPKLATERGMSPITPRSAEKVVLHRLYAVRR